ncbi:MULTISPECIES: enoyl-CoA hydratase/isomerase family protein [Actinomycetes]|uniref:enoyl-CoA hydratase/isomerase family protein n=1 Tax=Actinomycetes TaxID=1760 RepID=UPI0004BF92E0|nr:MULTISPECIES: enoyl-CoA hydratase/isomerase family protein [Actinomycetes]
MNTGDTGTVLVAADGPIRTLTLNRPQRRNALNAELIADLDQALSAAEADPDAAAIVLAGAGPSFCAGADLKYFLELDRDGHSPMEFLRDVSALCTRLETSRLPVIAAVHGHAVAGGMELALACDVAIAADTALIGDGHVRNNLLPAGGASVRLPRKLGVSMARWLALTGELVGAQQLMSTGWLHSVVPEHTLVDAATGAARTLAAQHGPAQARFKRLLFDLDTVDPHTGLARELDIFDAHWRAHDVPAALRQFLTRPTTPTTSPPVSQAGARQ